MADQSLGSPTHPVLIHADESAFHVALGARGAVPDRDIVLRWKEASEVALKPRGWSFTRGEERYALVQLRAPAEAEVSANLPSDYYFLIDRSGSMQGAKWEKTCEALAAFVKLLGERDRVWITLFESAWSDYAEAPQPAPGLLRDKRFRALVNLGTGGGTELLPAAEHVLGKIAEHSPEGSATVIIITDGQVGNEAAVLKRFRQAAGLPVHTFGIDTAVNDAFLKSLAKQQGGQCWLQTPNDDIAGTVAGLADRLRNEAIEIAGVLGSGERHVFSLHLEPSANAALPLLWARERMETLIAADRNAEALALAKKHNILCEGAAFIAWDEEEKVEVAQREIYQPNQEVFADMICASTAAPCAPPPSMAAGVMRRGAGEYGGGYGGGRATTRQKCAPPAQAAPKSKPEAGSLAKRLTAAGVDDKLAAVLELWAEAKWLTKALRSRALKELLAKLGAPEATAGERVLWCRQFIEKHLASEPAIYREAMNHLEAWQAAVGA